MSPEMLGKTCLIKNSMLLMTVPNQNLSNSNLSNDRLLQ